MPFLNWINDDIARRQYKNVAFHLLEKQEHYGASDANNLLIQGDNLIALRALLPFYKGKVKCIYIDPPYNTGSAFAHYDDNLEHSQWLSTMLPRLQLLRQFLSEDGSIWVSIDDDEQAYLKVILDEIFGRQNFVSSVIWEKKFSPQNDAKWLSDSHDFILVYTKNKESWRPNLLPRTDEMNARYKNPDNDPRGPWTSGDCSVKTYSANNDYPITTPSGRVVNPPAGYCWRFSRNSFAEMVADNRIWFGEKGDNVPRVKRFLSDVKQGITAMTIWKHTDVGHNQDAKKEVKEFNSASVFDTPKPERLIERVLTLSTSPGDLVLDSFLGSGTTAAVAHKMGRRYIGIEMGEHAKTHCIPRLQKVIEGEQGGISKAVNWQGGGGFDFYTLGEPVFDEIGLINPQVKFETLAAYLWQSETGEPSQPEKSPFLGEHKGVGIYLLFSDVLGADENVLNYQRLKTLLNQYPFDGEKIIYADACTGISDIELKRLHVTFKQIPFDIRQ